jgi:hypothetical protein
MWSMTNTYPHILAGQIPATSPAVGKANAKLSLLLFACYGQLGGQTFLRFTSCGKLGMCQTYLILHATANTGLQQREAVRRTDSIGSSGSPLREEPEQRGSETSTHLIIIALSKRNNRSNGTIFFIAANTNTQCLRL